MTTATRTNPRWLLLICIIKAWGWYYKFDTGRQRCRVIPLSEVILGNAFNSETNNYPWISPWQHSPIVHGCTYTGYYKAHGEMSSCIQEGNIISYITSLNRLVIRGITLIFKIAIPHDLQIFLCMRPAAILLHGAAVTNPRFPGTGWSDQWGSPNLGGPSLRSATQTGCWGAEVHVGAETTDSSAEAVQLRWHTLCEGDQLLVGCL